ncbi:MAG TPA: aminotransferase class I/II-fold pyridoxal phosphate-dependent enzyme [Bacteroides sp.]|nr:aminotransferase class I/II-fold pyridoxal phosphate-dependent enzyme [Bacteroides sp.]
MKSLKTTCVHAGTIKDEKNGGVNSPIYTSTSYAYLDAEEAVYPRYYNIPNSEALGEKIAALEMAEKGMVFSSGMAAITSALLAFLEKGDHAIFQTGLYGGTFHFVSAELERFGIAYDIAADNNVETFEKLIRDNTKLVYIETPSNPLLKITDIAATAKLARKHGIISMIDNTFASPVNQTPLRQGIDVTIHSATKYLGGHSDICAGALACNEENFIRIRSMARSLGGSLNAQDVYLLERSIKTLVLRVEQQSANAGILAERLSGLEEILKVHYPGLPDHPEHETARAQMNGFGGMLSFELKNTDPVKFQRNLQLIRPTVSLGGLDTIICSPTMTSHRHLSTEDRIREGISDNLLRLSVGIEDVDDLWADLKQAI